METVHFSQLNSLALARQFPEELYPSDIHSGHRRSSATCAGQLSSILPNLFAWQDLGTFSTDLKTWHISKVYDNACEAFTQLSRSHSSCAPLRSILDSLEGPGRRRFLLAPETLRRITKLRYNTENHIEYFHNSLNAELALYGNTKYEKACWSGLGDVYFGASTNPNERGHIFAPRAGGLVPIDFTSPHARLINSMPNCPFEEYSQDDADEVVQNINTAIAVVESVNSSAAALFYTFVHVIVPRRNPLDSSAFSASSTPSHIGRVLLRNGHLMSIGDLVDTIVHEAVHGVLNLLELRNAYVVDPSRELPFLESPWSGKSLSLHTYIHACFVWYGLVHFWTSALNTSLIASEIASAYLERAVRGFRDKNPAQNIIPHSTHITREMLDCLIALQGHLQVR